MKGRGGTINKKNIKIPFWKTVGGAYGSIFKNLGEFIRLTWALAIITYSINFGIAYSATANGVPALASLTYLIQTIAMSIYAIAWHRTILLNKPQGYRWGYVRLGKRELLFIITGAAFSLVLFGFSAGIGFTIGIITEFKNWVPYIFGFIAFIILGFVFIRFTLIYPRIAIDGNFDLKQCWQKSKNNLFRLYFGGALSSLPFFIIAVIISKIAVEMIQSGSSFFGVVVFDLSALVFTFAGIAATAAFLSYAYKILNPDDLNISSYTIAETTPHQYGGLSKNNSVNTSPRESYEEEPQNHQKQETPKSHSGFSDREQSDIIEKECPRCAEIIKVRAKYCRYCSYEYTEKEFSQEQEEFEKKE